VTAQGTDEIAAQVIERGSDALTDDEWNERDRPAVAGEYENGGGCSLPRTPLRP
jgi:hypothetical protein